MVDLDCEQTALRAGIQGNHAETCWRSLERKPDMEAHQEAGLVRVLLMGPAGWGPIGSVGH